MAPPTNKGMTFPPEPLTEEEIRSMLAVTTDTPVGVRSRGIIGTMYGTGLRVTECASLYPRDVDMQDGSVRVRHGKGNKARQVGFDPGGRELLAPWLELRTELGYDRKSPIFVNLKGPYKGEQVTRRYIARLLVDLGEKAGIDKRIHPHGIRHSFAYRLANDGVPVHQIQRQLGHSNLAMTQRYISHLNPRDVIDMMQDREW